MYVHTFTRTLSCLPRPSCRPGYRGTHLFFDPHTQAGAQIRTQGTVGANARASQASACPQPKAHMCEPIDTSAASEHVCSSGLERCIHACGMASCSLDRPEGAGLHTHQGLAPWPLGGLCLCRTKQLHSVLGGGGGARGLARVETPLAEFPEAGGKARL